MTIDVCALHRTRTKTNSRSCHLSSFFVAGFSAPTPLNSVSRTRAAVAPDHAPVDGFWVRMDGSLRKAGANEFVYC
jgi:hypothetical protein